MTNEMLTPVLEDAGLGFFIFKGNPGWFGHGGADEGFQALLGMSTETGKGAVIMADSDNGNSVGALFFRSVVKEYGWNYNFGDEDVRATELFLIALANGSTAALQRYDDFKAANSPDHKVDEAILNTLGYHRLSSGKTSDAIAVFQRNVREYPQSDNVYDGLGEAYMKAGEKKLAIQNYEKSLQLDPKNLNAVEMLRRLNEMK
jgi:tetratricopeptide (TPR) repeat protein